jgi:hypothetical protein
VRKSEGGEDEGSETSGRRVEYHYHQMRGGGNGNGSTSSKLNSVLLYCLLAIVGFIGVQVWGMNSRLASVEAILTMMEKSGIVPPR